MEVSGKGYYDRKMRDLVAESEIERMCRMLKDFLVSTGADHISVEATSSGDGVFNTVFVHFGEQITVRHSRQEGWAEGLFQEARTKET